eukprot:Lankesteria_metandrocarpae@DN600_c0_g1_i1.p1
MAEISFFNIKHGYCEALVRGLRSGLLSPDDYRRVAMSETLDDLRTALEETDYGGFLMDEPLPLAVTTIGAKCREKFVAEFKHIRAQAQYPLDKFLDFICVEKMIDNVINLIQGTSNKIPIEEVLARVDPLGWFPEMRAIAAMDLTSSYTEFYRTLLVETPVGPYFEHFLESHSVEENTRSIQDVGQLLSETDLEFMRSVLKKGWLEDFYSFCTTLEGTTAEVMRHLLHCEADFRVLSVTLNSINTNMGTASDLGDRNTLYPNFGYLYPEGTDRMRKAWNDATVRHALDGYPQYMTLYDQCKSFYIREDQETFDPAAVVNTTTSRFKTLEDLIYAEQITMCEMAFEQQFHFGVFYAWSRLKEQEIRNIKWMADMIIMRRKQDVEDIIPLFQPRV